MPVDRPACLRARSRASPGSCTPGSGNTPSGRHYHGDLSDLRRRRQCRHRDVPGNRGGYPSRPSILPGHRERCCSSASTQPPSTLRGSPMLRLRPLSGGPSNPDEPSSSPLVTHHLRLAGPMDLDDGARRPRYSPAQRGHRRRRRQPPTSPRTPSRWRPPSSDASGAIPSTPPVSRGDHRFDASDVALCEHRDPRLPGNGLSFQRRHRGGTLPPTAGWPRGHATCPMCT